MTIQILKTCLGPACWILKDRGKTICTLWSFLIITVIGQVLRCLHLKHCMAGNADHCYVRMMLENEDTWVQKSS